jgi:hypothetical protein
LGKDVDTRFCRGYKRFLGDAIIFSARDALLARRRLKRLLLARPKR